MTQPHPQDSEQVAYLESVFRLDPADQIEDVLALRNGFFTAIRPRFNSVKPETTTDGQAVLEQRAQVQQQLDEIRRSFWETEPEQTRARLDQLDVDESPDLKLAVNRMRNVLTAFHEVEMVVKYKHCSYDFWQLLKDVLVAAPRESGRLQQSLLHWIAQDDGVQKQSRWTAKFIRRKCPHIAQIETAWLKEILQSRSVKVKCKKTGKSSEESWGGRVIVVALGIWVAGITWSGVSRSTSSRPMTRNIYSTTQSGLKQTPIETQVTAQRTRQGNIATPSLSAESSSSDLIGNLSPESQRAVEGNSAIPQDDNFIDRLSRQESERQRLDDSGTTWPPRSGQRYESFLEAEKKTVSPPRNSRGTKKSLPLPQQPYDSIPADSILKQPLESQSQSGSLIFR